MKKDRSCELIDDFGKFLRTISNNALSSLITEPSGSLCFTGSYNLFSVQFKANGLFAIFGIPQRLLLNVMLPVDDVLGNDSLTLTEQLELSGDIVEMGAYMDAYLTKKLLTRKQKVYTSAIADVSRLIMKNQGTVSIDLLARHVNMSLRNFERRFIDEVGVSPKQYIRIIRFYLALENKMQNPKKSWTSICYDYGYFDQAHFIKECREFSSRAPEELFKHTPIPKENFMKKVEL